MKYPTHNECKYFGRKKCPHIEDEIMRRATQEISETHGGKYNNMEPFPDDEEINNICKYCGLFTQK